MGSLSPVNLDVGAALAQPQGGSSEGVEVGAFFSS